MNILEFAKRAGMSTATISRAFHQPEKLRPQTRETILALAESLGYYPNPSGRALVTGRLDALGLVWPLEVEGADAVFPQRVLALLTSHLASNDLDLLICPVHRQKQSTLSHARRTFQRSRCDAWILLYPRHNDELVIPLRASRKPVICLMGALSEVREWKFVSLNQKAWIESALSLLHERGGKRVAFIGYRTGELDHEERLTTFKKLAPKYFGANFEVYCEWPPKVDTIREFLAAKRTDAVIGVDDRATYAALQACTQLGWEVPKKVQMIGIDAVNYDPDPSVSLTTFRQPLEDMTAYAVELALGIRKNSKVFEPEFIEGDTLRIR